MTFIKLFVSQTKTKLPLLAEPNKPPGEQTSDGGCWPFSCRRASNSEQNWSQYDFVHNKRRNVLKSVVASQLVFVYTSLRLIEKQTDFRRHLNVDSDYAKAKSVCAVEDQQDGNASDTDREEASDDETNLRNDVNSDDEQV